MAKCAPYTGPTAPLKITPINTPDLNAVAEDIGDDLYDEAAEALSAPIPQTKVPSLNNFKPLALRAFLRDDLKWGRGGVASITLQIPFEYRHLTVELLNITQYPIEVYIRPCRPKVRRDS